MAVTADPPIAKAETSPVTGPLGIDIHSSGDRCKPHRHCRAPKSSELRCGRSGTVGFGTPVTARTALATHPPRESKHWEFFGNIEPLCGQAGSKPMDYLAAGLLVNAHLQCKARRIVTVMVGVAVPRERAFSPLARRPAWDGGRSYLSAPLSTQGRAFCEITLA